MLLAYFLTSSREEVPALILSKPQWPDDELMIYILVCFCSALASETFRILRSVLVLSRSFIAGVVLYLRAPPSTDSTSAHGLLLGPWPLKRA